jgi:hypothetical protein
VAKSAADNEEEKNAKLAKPAMKHRIARSFVFGRFEKDEHSVN